MNYKLVGSAATGALLAGTVIFLSFVVGEDFNASSLNLLIVVFGFALGWLIGILVSPYTRKEAESFSKYTKALGVFVTGYVVSKLDNFIEVFFQPDFLLDSVNGFRLISFAAALIVSLIITFVFRQYANDCKAKDCKQSAPSEQNIS